MNTSGGIRIQGRATIHIFHVHRSYKVYISLVTLMRVSLATAGRQS